MNEYQVARFYGPRCTTRDQQCFAVVEVAAGTAAHHATMQMELAMHI